MTIHRSGNLGQTSLRGKRRARNSMQTYDTLPPVLRAWLCQAALPWSPSSARKIWQRAQAKGLSADDTLALLQRSERQTLARDEHALFFSDKICQKTMS
ncbi:DUF6525 family protein [Aestuariibius sp. HNIBRBA575]|uniref:DUF6525 family protein n=1 Tax=Aestuariibius sp. HNIBRBA575 TaxID=3233343 RepID=UPI0034A4124A